MASSPFAVLDRTIPRRIIFGLLLLGATAAMVAVSIDSTRSTRAAPDRDPAIEALIPTSGADVLRQSEVGVDLADGYAATLAVNGTPIPDDQITGGGAGIPSLGRYVFAPGPDKVLESLRSGTNCVTVEFWKARTPNETAVYSWCFEAA
ncbi:hypothetical protein [Actinomarinicola tropica]|uniref:Uncharacterized protein n=1 Tax=Actinomarinicola tropica TaxID=2789776 RepID=A0A5Q2RCL5_9ACTN|nr:hypothetical protein [Actinomarinicola tropica]QGG94629.1 hypothetical protein GH723_05625 [Actinomarinicola tropica]